MPRGSRARQLVSYKKRGKHVELSLTRRFASARHSTLVSQRVTLRNQHLVVSGGGRQESSA